MRIPENTEDKDWYERHRCSDVDYCYQEEECATRIPEPELALRSFRLLPDNKNHLFPLLSSIRNRGALLLSRLRRKDK